MSNSEVANQQVEDHEDDEDQDRMDVPYDDPKRYVTVSSSLSNLYSVNTSGPY